MKPRCAEAEGRLSSLQRAPGSPPQRLATIVQGQRAAATTVTPTRRRALDKKRSVSFSEERNSTHLIEHLDDMEDEVVLAVWFTAEECSEMKSEAYSTVAAADAGLPDVEVRGLEGQTSNGAWIAYKARKDAYDIVLGEMEDAERGGYKVDWEKVARMYREECSDKSLRDAMERARDDRRAIQDYMTSLEDIVAEIRSLLLRGANRSPRSNQNKLVKRTDSFDDQSTESTTPVFDLPSDFDTSSSSSSSSSRSGGIKNQNRRTRSIADDDDDDDDDDNSSSSSSSSGSSSSSTTVDTLSVSSADLREAQDTVKTKVKRSTAMDELQHSNHRAKPRPFALVRKPRQVDQSESRMNESCRF